MRGSQALLAGLILATTFAGLACSSSDSPTVVSKEAAATTTAAPSTTTSAAPTTVTSTSAPPTSVAPSVTCEPANAEAVATIEASLTGRATSLGETASGYDGDFHYVVANIYDADGTRISNADSWVIWNGTPFALSGSAREYSLLGDGRDLPGNPNAGREYINDASVDCTR